MTFFQRCTQGVVLLLLSGLLSPVMASVVITGTRIIYPEQEREITIRLTNNGTLPALVSAWLDRGDPNQSAEDADIPFLLSPALFRMDPAKNQTLRMMRTSQQALPQDQESLFWLNVYEVPPESEQAQAGLNTMQLALRTRIKVFVRPPRLPGAVTAAPGTLQWRLIEVDGKPVLQASNPSPYHISFATVSLTRDQQHIDASGVNAMVLPGATFSFPLPEGQSLAAMRAMQVEFSSIDDYGVPRPFTSQLQP